MLVRTGLTGPYPRPEALVRATRDLDRRRASPEEVETLFASTEREVLALERRSGFATLTGGYLRQPDLFRAFAESWEGFTVGPLARWFETNTFYRQPILVAPPLRTPGAFAARLPPSLADDPSHARVLLPGPYTFAQLLDNDSGETETAIIHRLGRQLADEVRELRVLGYATFQFSDPSIVVHPPKGPKAEAVVEAYRAIESQADGATTILWTYGADAAPTLPLLDRPAATVVGIDLADTDVEAIPEKPGRAALGLGVIDSRTTLPEDPAEIERVVREAARRRGASTVWLGPGGPLDLLPSGPAERKVAVLAAVAERFRSEEAS